MTGYSTYKMRAQVLNYSGFENPHNMLREIMILIEAVDWHTGVTEFTGKKHWDNWFASTARRFNLDSTVDEDTGEVVEGAQRLKNALALLEGVALAQTTSNSIALIVHSDKPLVWAMLEVAS